MLRSMVWMLLLGASLSLWPSTARSGTLHSHLNIAVQLHDTVEETTKACDIQDPEDPNRLISVVGCWIPTPNAKRNGTIHGVTPKSWCDTNAVETIGHEVMHAIGWSHGPTFEPPYFVKESTYGCQNGAFWKPDP